jgi:hypothetical protein
MRGFQKLNEGNERGMRNRMTEMDWQGNEKPDEMGMTVEWNRMRGEIEWWWDDVFN